MTTEQKAKAYDEALERANAIYTGKYKPEIAAFCKMSLEAIFPELKESEDERIVENIKKAVVNYWSDEPLDEILAWLKSPCPQDHWKPSEKQMLILSFLIKFHNLQDEHNRILQSLYCDLKRL